MNKTIFVQFVPAEGKAAEVEQVLRRMVEATRKEPGNVMYDLYQSTSPEGHPQFNLLERYSDDAANEAHRASDHFRQYRIDIASLLAAPISVTLLSPVDAR
jgi:quinol monooxygenase YgiN